MMGNTKLKGNWMLDAMEKKKNTQNEPFPTQVSRLVEPCLLHFLGHSVALFLCLFHVFCSTFLNASTSWSSCLCVSPFHSANLPLRFIFRSLPGYALMFVSSLYTYFVLFLYFFLVCRWYTTLSFLFHLIFLDFNVCFLLLYFFYVLLIFRVLFSNSFYIPFVNMWQNQKNWKRKLQANTGNRHTAKWKEKTDGIGGK